jgi:hypothetical protein
MPAANYTKVTLGGVDKAQWSGSTGQEISLKGRQKEGNVELVIRI